MFRTMTLTTAAAVAAFTAMPSAAEARHRDGYYDSGRYERAYRGDRYYRGRSQGYYGRGQGYYGRGQGYYGDRYYNGRRCSGTTGTIVGGVAGALLGREIDRGGRSRWGRRDSGTTGAIIGGAIGALAGRSIDKSSCRR